MWAPNVAALSERYRVYAIDRLGDIGRSVYLRPLGTSADVVRNLDELLSALQLGTDVRLMGLSFGGWEAAEYALAHPERLARVVLIAPAATLFNLPPDFAWRGLLLLLPVRGFMESMMRWSLPHLGAATDAAGRRTLRLAGRRGLSRHAQLRPAAGRHPAGLERRATGFHPAGDALHGGRGRDALSVPAMRSGVWLASRRGCVPSSFEGRDTT